MVRLLLILMIILGFNASVFAQDVQYELDIEITWSSDTHPFDWPEGGGHMSGVTAITHNDRYVLFKDGYTATSGLRFVAERGRVRVLRSELEEAIDRGWVKNMIDGSGIDKVPDRIRVTFPISETHSKFSFLTMIAPSPDWFIGLSAVNLRDDAGWRKETRYLLWAWDAGTNSGTSYTSKNDPNQPAESIRLLATPHFLDEAGLKKVGTATFKLIQ